jgi:sulfopyruvate decarboxylase TPP-binding subunit
LIVSWRGFGGKDAPEHIVMGEVCTKILETIGIPYRIVSAERAQEDIHWASETMAAHNLPAVLMVKKGIFE